MIIRLPHSRHARERIPASLILFGRFRCLHRLKTTGLTLSPLLCARQNITRRDTHGFLPVGIALVVRMVAILLWFCSFHSIGRVAQMLLMVQEKTESKTF